MDTRAKARMAFGFVRDTTNISCIWGPDFGNAVNFSDLCFDIRQTADMSL